MRDDTDVSSDDSLDAESSVDSAGPSALDEPTDGAPDDDGRAPEFVEREREMPGAEWVTDDRGQDASGAGEAAESPITAPLREPLPYEATLEGRASAKRALEALVCVAEEPADPRLLAQLLEVSSALVDELCLELADDYEAGRRGFELVRVAGGWRMQSHPDLSPFVEQYVLTGQSAKLSNAALESLAIVAYKQPISRAQIAAIRGVNVDGVIRTLTQRGYVTEVARDPGPGQASLYGTTSLFLERIGLNSLADLPPVADFVPGADVVESLEQGLRFEEIDESSLIDASAEAGEVPAPAAEPIPGLDDEI
jgi:segregation and condensation protein B